MKQQVFVIHGGHTHASYEEYIEYLKTYSVSLQKLQGSDWKKHLQEKLGDMYEVYQLSMPNKQNAQYSQWKLWFEKYVPLMNDSVVLIGHSLGGVFLMKYLSEGVFSKNIAALCIIAAPFDWSVRVGSTLPEFAMSGTFHHLLESGKRTIFYHSKDDPVVEFSEMEKYQKELPEATYRVFEDRQHFNQEEFPEIIEDIKNFA